MTNIYRYLLFAPLFALLLSYALLASPVLRADNKQFQNGFSPQQESQLDALFSSLKQAQNENEARNIEKIIWQVWTQPDDTELNTLMKNTISHIRGYNYNGALDILNQVIRKWPEYSEGRNQLATVYFLQEKYTKSLEEITKTLEIEPRHFGSMAGRAVIRIRQGKEALGYQSIFEAMEIHPYLAERHFIPPSVSPNTGAATQ